MNIIAAIFAAAFIISISALNIAQNVESRALSELEATVGMQSSAFKNHMDVQFQALRLIADMLENGRHFDSEKIRPTLSSIVRTFRLCTLCLADVEGNTTDYQGNVLGSCADREYFQEIMDGSHDQICEYLAATKETNEPRVILSVPAYDENGEMLGVLFCSKEISILEDSLFSHEALFDTTSAIFICDEAGQIIAANENGYKYFSGDDDGENRLLNINDLSSSLHRIYEDGTARRVKINGDYCFAGYTALDECGWGLYLLVDAESASETYRENQDRIENTVGAVFLVFAAALAYIIFLGMAYLKRKTREALVVKRNYENYKNILLEAQCAVVEYDIENTMLTVLQSELEAFKLDSLNGSLDAYEKFKREHPEYDFGELKKELELTKADGKTYSFESILTVDNQKLCWLRTMIIPITDEDGTVKKILFAVFDITDIHRKSEKISEIYAQIPGGVHRCYLDKPIHVEYFSDGLCRMLGYTREEIDRIIGPEQDYSLLLYKEDRPAFEAFVERLSIHGGTETCEYRMICADGSHLAVSDTMDAKRSSTGTMYGYSIVTDLCRYKEMQQELERELDKKTAARTEQNKKCKQSDAAAFSLQCAFFDSGNCPGGSTVCIRFDL